MKLLSSYKKVLPLPALRALRKLGQDINEARRRRRIPIQLMADRANVSRATIGKIEKGDPTTSMWAFAAVIFVLGMTEHLANLLDGARDIRGRDLEDDRLPQRIRIPSRKKKVRQTGDSTISQKPIENSEASHELVKGQGDE